jgi:septum formation protein
MKFQRPIILASSSPRRQFLMREAGYEFKVISPEADESFPVTMPAEQVPAYLAKKKAEVLQGQINNEIVIASDTVVVLHNEIMNKPLSHGEAFDMLSKLSGKTHTVITGVCLLSRDKVEVFDDRTDVTFKKLTKEEINFYIDHYKPFDKAGAYGAQDWIGMVAIEKITGSYFTVMGLPMHLVYEKLNAF